LKLGLSPAAHERQHEMILRLAKKVCGTYNAHDAVPVLPSPWARTLLKAE
jgi:hypothetical protein